MRFKILDVIGSTKISKWKNVLKHSQYWSKSTIEEYQIGKLKLMIGHAYENVPYYNQLFKTLNLTPEDFNSIDDLKKLPVLKRKDIIDNHDAYLADNYKQYKPQKRSTGGTTGTPLNYYSDLNSWSLHWALKYRAWSWGGYSLGDPIGLLGGASVIPDNKPSIKRKVWNKFNNFYPLPASHLNDTNIHALPGLPPATT